MCKDCPFGGSHELVLSSLVYIYILAQDDMAMSIYVHHSDLMCSNFDSTMFWEKSHVEVVPSATKLCDWLPSSFGSMDCDVQHLAQQQE